MYCSRCGSPVSPNLSYCNHCGARLNGATDEGVSKTSEMKPERLLFFMTAVFVFGLGAIIFLMMAMKFVFGPENMGLIIAFTLLSFVIMLGLEGVFVSMLWRHKKTDKEAAKRFREAKPGVLPEPAFSVTEHTTRSLEPAVNEPKTE